MKFLTLGMLIAHPTVKDFHQITKINGLENTIKMLLLLWDSVGAMMIYRHIELGGLGHWGGWVGMFTQMRHTPIATKEVRKDYIARFNQPFLKQRFLWEDLWYRFEGDLESQWCLWRQISNQNLVKLIQNGGSYDQTQDASCFESHA